MSAERSKDLPDFDVIADHLDFIANQFRLMEKMPVLKDPDIMAKLNKLDELTSEVNNMRPGIEREVTQFLLTSLIPAIKYDLMEVNKALKDDITEKLGALNDNITKHFNVFMRDFASEISVPKDEIDGLVDELKDEVYTVEGGYHQTDRYCPG